MQIWLFAALAVLGLGCQHGAQVAPVTPSVTANATQGMVIALGQGIRVSGSWSGSCEEHWVERKLGKDHEPSTVACHGKGFALRIRCHSPCRLVQKRPSARPTPGDVQALDVIPLEVGPFEFDATLESDAPGPAPSYHAPTVMVRAPDRVTLMCLYPSGPRRIDGLRGTSKLEVCDHRPLMADTPWVRPIAELGGTSYLLTTATLNGRTDLPEKSIDRTTHEFADGIVSLTDVFRALPMPPAKPDHGEDDGIAPGRYEVVIGFGGSETIVPLVVERR